MISFSNTKIVGRLGKDPDIRETKNGKKVASLSIAVDIGWGAKRTTQWYNAVVWEGSADYAEDHLHKGDIVYVDGTFRSREYETSSGEKKTVWEVQARELQAIYGNSNASDLIAAPDDEDDDEDLPF